MTGMFHAEYVLRPRCDLMARWPGGLVKVDYAETNVISDRTLSRVAPVRWIGRLLTSLHDCAIRFPRRLCFHAEAPTLESRVSHINSARSGSFARMAIDSENVRFGGRFLLLQQR